MPYQNRMNLRPPEKSVDQTWTPDDIYDAVSSDLNIIHRFAEDRRVERKSAKLTDRILAEYYTVYANKQPHGGVIFFGVEDDGTFSGCSKLSANQLDKIERAHVVYCPEAKVELNHLSVYNDKGEADFIIAIRVYYHESKLVETTRGEAFTRDGSSKRKLTDSEKREIRIKKREIDFEREDVILNWPDDFNLDLVDEYCQKFTKQRCIEETQSPEKILANNRLGRFVNNLFYPNSACALLFANDPRMIFPGAYIRLMKFAGYEERSGENYNLIDGKDFWIQGSLPTLISEAEKIIESEIRNFTGRINGKFQSRPEYPKEVWLEAVVNACVHRSYNFRNMPISVKMFDDKLVVQSPGGFPPPTTATTISDNGHNPRNPYLMEALYYFDQVKCAHEGVRRMNEVMDQAKLPSPEFTEAFNDGNSVKVILRNNVEQRKSFIDSEAKASLDESNYKLLGENEKKIVNYLAEYGSINTTEAGKLLGVSWPTSKKVITKLINMGFCKYSDNNAKGKRNPKKRVILVN